MSNQVWGDEHTAEATPLGTVLYDVDDDSFTVKTGENQWDVYYNSTNKAGVVLRDHHIDGDRGDQIVGRLDRGD